MENVDLEEELAVEKDGSVQWTVKEKPDGTVCLLYGVYNDLDIKKLSIPSKIDGKIVTEIGEDFRSLTMRKTAELYRNDPEFEEYFEKHGGVMTVSFNHISVPSSVKVLGKDALGIAITSENQTVELAEGLEEIGDLAFDGINTLAEIKLPESLRKIGRKAFQNTAIKSIVIPKGVEKLEETFYKCESLESVELHDNITEIGKDTFAYCRKLESIVIPDNVQKLGKGAFSFCNSLKTVVIGAGVKDIDTCIFLFSKALQDVYIKSTQKEWKKIKLDKSNKNALKKVKLYFYSEEQPKKPKGLWHYAADGKTPVAW